MEKNRKHIFVYWLMMVGLFVVVLLTQQIVASIMQGSLSNSKFGEEATFEILWAGLVLIIVLLFKNKYIFTQRREGFFDSIKYIVPELVLSLFFIGLNTMSIVLREKSIDWNSLFNLALYCLFIGIVEEFLCRGWLLNEFLERYSRNRKEIFLSIIFSSVIFGIIHFLNIGETQGFFETLVQVMNATAGGVFLALVYYKTRNIWVAVATHAIWDFSLFLGDINSLGDCLSGTPRTITVIMNIIRGIVLIIAYIFFCYWLYRQTDLYPKEIVSKKNYLIVIGIIIYISGLLFIHDYNATSSLCPNYTSKAINHSYRVSFYDYEFFSIQKTNYVLKKDMDTGRLVIYNQKTGNTAFLTDDQNYSHYLLVDNDTDFSIMIQTSNNVVLYGNYNKMDLIIYEKSFLKKMKNQLKKVVVPTISDLCVIEILNDNYHYPTIRSNIGELLYFDRKNDLYLNKE